MINLYKNQRQINKPEMIQQTQNKEQNIFEKQSCHFDQSQQTTYDQSQENQFFISDQTSNQSDDQQDEVQILQTNANIPIQVNNYRTQTLQREQISKYNFFSISQNFSELILQKHHQNFHDMSHINHLLKCKKLNLQRRVKKLSILRKLIGPKHKKRFNEIKQMIQNQQIQHDKVHQMEINFYKCQCHHVTISRQSFLKHLKYKSHKVFLSIQTERQRKNQQKLYNTFSKDDQFSLFDQTWLYKSFQVIFIEGGIHYSQCSINQIFLKLIKGIEIKQEDKILFQQTNFNKINLKKKWRQNYVNLHKFHNGNERNCHKCLNINQHICLFALALIRLIQKNKGFYQSMEEKSKVQTFSKIINFILIQFTDFRAKQKLNLNNILQKFLPYQSIRKLVVKQLKKYFQTFNYIDLTDYYESLAKN